MELDSGSVMRPKLIRIGNACYRRFDAPQDGSIFVYGDVSKNKSPDQQQQQRQSRKFNIDALEEMELGEEEFDENEIGNLGEGESLQQQKNGFVLQMHVPPKTFPLLIGRGAQTKRELENECDVRLDIPTNEQVRNETERTAFIRISAAQKSSIVACRRRIAEIVENFRSRQPFNYFVSIPFADNRNVMDKFREFKELVLSDVNCSTVRGIPEEAFQRDGRFHLTLRVLYLADLHEKKLAVERLQTFKATIIDRLLQSITEPVQLRIKGLEIMNDDPAEAHILYAKVEEIGSRGLFQQIVNSAYDHFDSFSRPDNFDNINSGWKVKVHATLLNSKYYEMHLQRNTPQAASEDKGNKNSRKKFRKRYPMDVSEVLDKYGQFDFGTVQLNHILISSMEVDVATNNYGTFARIDF